MMEHVNAHYPSAVCFHATGKRDNARIKARFDGMGLGERMRLTDYIYDMPVQMLAADVVISRAGAMSISELALTGKASVVIPSPYVADQHQLKNAQALSHNGAGVCVEESTLTDGALTRAVCCLLEDTVLRESMGKNIRERFAVPDANQRIYEELKKICRKKGKNV
jgi:UDP-N-acetylglucosamine--N-acetylmuramyl-(pentapeptide) pyrophosphoryl-undecaprenol N-acetylglucosamine transferase